MATPKIPELNNNSIHDASAAEIRAYAEAVCGIDFDEDASRSLMINRVIESQDWLQKDPEDGATHIEILIGKEPGIEGNFPYRGGANGRMFSVKRGEPVIIPMNYWQSIKSAQARPGFTIVPLSDMKENAPAEERLARSGAPVSVIRYITK